ncbi:hypothetical protein KHA80_13760 [Anaerobacillus sp. HL2]|nr:hypothetical protein KHA80_13760 [Anaerobacillus sp. HL2]
MHFIISKNPLTMKGKVPSIGGVIKEIRIIIETKRSRKIMERIANTCISRGQVKVFDG